MNSFDSFGTQANWPDGTALADDRVIDTGKNYICELGQGMQNTVERALPISPNPKFNQSEAFYFYLASHWHGYIQAGKKVF